MLIQNFSREHLTSTIEEVASGYVGELMAKAASTAHFKRLGIDQEKLDADHIEAILESLRRSLKVLIGDRTADKAVTEIKDRVGAP